MNVVDIAGQKENFIYELPKSMDCQKKCKYQGPRYELSLSLILSKLDFDWSAEFYWNGVKLAIGAHSCSKRADGNDVTSLGKHVCLKLTPLYSALIW